MPKYVDGLHRITFYCGKCGDEFDADEPEFQSDTYECGLCGTHGEVSLLVTCPKCQREITIKVREW